jgi:hypothetical protein
MKMILLVVCLILVLVVGLPLYQSLHPSPSQAQFQQQVSQSQSQEDFASVTNRTCQVDGGTAELSPDDTAVINRGKFWYIHYRGKTFHVQLGAGPLANGESHVEAPAQDASKTVYLRYNDKGFTRCTVEPKQ